MKNIDIKSVYGDVSVLPCAASAAQALEARGAAAREVSAVAVATRTTGATRTWDDAINGMKRAAFAPTHIQGSPAWSPPL